MAYLGSREIRPDMWPATGEAKGVFVNFARTSQPTTRPDGTALQEGDAYYLTTDDLFYVYNGSSFIAASSGTSSLQAAYNNSATFDRSADAFTISDSLTNATNTFVINKAGAGSGNLIDLNASTTFSGDFLNITCTNASTASQALVVESQASTRVTNALVQIDENGTGAVPTVAISGDAATTGPLLSVLATQAIAPVAGTDGMVTIALANAANGSEGLFIVNTTTTRTGACLGISDGGTTTGPMIRLVQTAASDGPAIAYTTSGSIVSDVVSLDLTNADTTARGIVITGQAAAHSVHLVDITNNSTSTGAALHINLSNTAASRGLIIDADGAVTGDFAVIDMANAGAGADGMLFTGSITTRTGDMLRIVDAATTGTGQSLEIQSTGAKDGTHLLLNVDGAGSGATVHCDIDGATTGPIFNIDLDATGSGIVFDIDIATSVWTGDIFNFNSTQAYAGDIFDLVLTNCAAGVRAMFITGSATTRTAHLIEIAEVGTPSGDTINISHGGASTGDGIHWVGTNAVAARALNLDGAGTRTVNMIDIDTTGADTAACIDITTTAVGASGVASALNIVQGTATMAAGADVVRINVTGTLSTTSNILALETNAGGAGSFALYIDNTGSGEAIKVDAGTVTFDETLLVSGALTAGAGVIFSGIETIAAGGTSTALSLTKTLHSVDADAGGDTFTLADGTIGQIMVITMLSATGTATVTPANLAGGTSVTFNAAGDSVTLMFVDTDWYIIGGNSYGVS